VISPLSQLVANVMVNGLTSSLAVVNGIAVVASRMRKVGI
jgi:hypothetical protein